MDRSRRELLTRALAAFAALAIAAPATADECDRIKDSDAFNRCLAGLGPARGAARAKGAAPPGADRARGRRLRRTAPSPFSAAPGGRKRWIFAPEIR